MKKSAPIPIATFCLVFFMIMAIISFIDAGTFINRLIRLIPNLVALLFVVLYIPMKDHRPTLWFLVFLLLAGLFAIGFEQLLFSYLTVISGAIAYAIIAYAPIPKLSSLKTSWLLRIFFVLALAMIGFMLYNLTQLSVDQYVGTSLKYLFYLSNLALVFLLGSALVQVHANPSKIHMLFLAFAAALILSELFRAASYYSETQIGLFFYGCRVLYVLALSLLLYIVGISEKETMPTKTSNQ